jgi:hypothetical protein
MKQMQIQRLYDEKNTFNNDWKRKISGLKYT